MDYLLVGLIGFALGALFGHRETGVLTLRSNITRHEFIPPIRIASIDHETQWQTWLRRYITLAEILEHERGNRIGWLPSYRMLHDVTGQTWRCFGIYDEFLAEHEIIEVVGRGGRRWLLGRADRRAVALNASPLPGRRPPRFDFTRLDRDSVTAYVTA